MHSKKKHIDYQALNWRACFLLFLFVSAFLVLIKKTTLKKALIELFNWGYVSNISYIFIHSKYTTIICYNGEKYDDCKKAANDTYIGFFVKRCKEKGVLLGRWVSRHDERVQRVWSSHEIHVLISWDCHVHFATLVVLAMTREYFLTTPKILSTNIISIPTIRFHPCPFSITFALSF